MSLDNIIRSGWRWLAVPAALAVMNILLAWLSGSEGLAVLGTFLIGIQASYYLIFHTSKKLLGRLIVGLGVLGYMRFLAEHKLNLEFGAWSFEMSWVILLGWAVLASSALVANEALQRAEAISTLKALE